MSLIIIAFLTTSWILQIIDNIRYQKRIREQHKAYAKLTDDYKELVGWYKELHGGSANLLNVLKEALKEAKAEKYASDFDAMMPDIPRPPKPTEQNLTYQENLNKPYH